MGSDNLTIVVAILGVVIAAISLGVTIGRGK